MPRPATSLAIAIGLIAAGLTTPGTAQAQGQPAPHYVSQFGTCGNGPGQFSELQSIAVAPNGDVFVADQGSGRVVRFDVVGNFVTAWPAITPVGIACAPDGSVYVTSIERSAIVHYDASGTELGSFGGFGHGNGQLTNPTGVAVGQGGKVFVCDDDDGRVQRFSAAGVFETRWGGLAAGLPHAYAIATDPLGDVYVIDAGNQRLDRFDANGVLLASWSHSGPFNQPITFMYGLAADEHGNVFVTDGIYRVEEYTPTGEWLTSWGTIGSGGAAFQLAWSIATAPGGVVYVSDRALCRVAKFQFDVAVPAARTSWGALKATYR